MFLYILDTSFNTVAMIDVFKSVIWTDRYQEAGDFELVCSPEAAIMTYAQIDYYVITERPWAKTFEGEVNATSGFVYGKDFFLGDMVQVANEYGMEGPSLVSEMVWSQDEEGFSCYPTFIAQNDQEEKEEESE